MNICQIVLMFSHDAFVFQKFTGVKMDYFPNTHYTEKIDIL